MSNNRGRGSGSGVVGGALGQLGKLTRLGKVVRREGVGGLVRQVLSGEALRAPEAEDSGTRQAPGKPPTQSESKLPSGSSAPVEASGESREEDFNPEVEHLRKALEQAKLDLLGQTTKLKNEIFDLKKRNSELLEQVVQLTKRERDLNKQVLDIQFQGSGHKADKKRLEIEVRDLKRALKEAEARAEAAEAAAERLQGAPAQVEAVAAEQLDVDAGEDAGARGDLAGPGAERLRELEDGLERARLDIRERDERIVDLEHRLEKADVRLKEMKRKLADKETQIRTLRSAKARLEKNLAKEKAENQGLLRELERLRKASARATEERRRRREASKASQLRVLQSAVTELQSAVLELRDVVDEGAVVVAEHPVAEVSDSGEKEP